MTGTAIVQEIVSILVSGLKSFATGIGGGIQSMVNGMFFTTTGDTTTLSVYAILVLCFAGVALTIGLSRLIFNWLGSLGN